MTEYKTSCCGNRTILEKIFIVVIILLFCLLIVLFAVFVFHLKTAKHQEKPVSLFSANTRPRKSQICMTADCVKAAAQILEFLDLSVNPCDDFSKFVCGKFWYKSSGILLEDYEKKALSQLDALITDDVEEVVIAKSWELQRKFYKLCMDVEALEVDKGEQFLGLVKKIGDWPVLYGRFWDKRKFDWTRSTVECRRYGLSYDNFLDISISSGANGTEDIFYLTINPPAVIDLPDQLSSMYIDTMSNISIEMGAPPYLAQNQFLPVYEFQKKLKSFVKLQFQTGKEVITSIEKLGIAFPSVPWKDFLSELTRTNLTETTVIRSRAHKYLQEFLKFIKNTPQTTQANYVVWRNVENFHAYLQRSVRTTYESYLYNLGSPENSNRHMHCLDRSKFYFPSVAELAYVRKYLKPMKRTSIKELIRQVKKQLKGILASSDWLQEEYKNTSLDIVATMEEHVGSSDEAYFGDIDKIVEMEHFDFETHNIINMIAKLKIRHTDNFFKKINKNAKEETRNFVRNSPILGQQIFHNQDFNYLEIPTPYLQNLMYNLFRPQYMNFGALGSAIGYEIVKALVLETNSSKIECLLKDYSHYGDINQLKKEIIADSLGPELAYQVYQKQAKNKDQEPLLPSLAYSQEQIFWIMTELYKCYDPKYQKLVQIEGNKITSLRSMMTGLKNSHSFSADFNCPVDSNMNPQSKCEAL